MWIKPTKYLKCFFSQDVVLQAQGKIAQWKEQALSLTGKIHPDDAVMQDFLRILESLNDQLLVMAKLHGSTLKHKHWRAMFEGQALCPYCNTGMQPQRI